MELKDLIGIHELSGVDTSIENVEIYEGHSVDANTVRFVLDGKTYKAVEDPSDGYRSYCNGLLITDEKVSNMFPPQKVLAKMKEDSHGYVNDTIQFIDMVTCNIVLEVGTDNTDDYYPFCVMEWNPQNMACNIGKQ